MVSTKTFFFNVDEDYVFEDYVADSYVLLGNKNYVFDDFDVAGSSFDFDELPLNKIFDVSTQIQRFDYDSDYENEVFDPEFNDQALIAETGEYLITEDNIQILY